MNPNSYDHARSACEANARGIQTRNGLKSPPSQSPEPTSREFSCTLCGAEMVGVHCKLICPNCGYREDCSDLFANAP